MEVPSAISGRFVLSSRHGALRTEAHGPVLFYSKTDATIYGVTAMGNDTKLSVGHRGGPQGLTTGPGGDKKGWVKLLKPLAHRS